LKSVWLIDSEAKIEERFNGKINGIGDSIMNDEVYIWEYKESAKEIQYIDSTGYINLRIKEFRENSGASTNASNTVHSQNPLVPMGVNHHSSSAHGMIGNT